jgi:hypothetical protein
MFKQPIVNINISWNRETFKLLLIIFIFWSLISYLYFYKNNNVNNITNSSTQPDIGEIGEPISIIQSQSPSQSPSQSQSKDVSIISFINNLSGTYYQRIMYLWKVCTEMQYRCNGVMEIGVILAKYSVIA